MRWLMSRLPAVLLTVALVAAFACSSGKDSVGGKQPDPPKTPLETAQRFFDLWEGKEYGDMYDLISAEARATISKEDFVKRYNAIAEEATITGIDYDTGPNVVEEDTEIPAEVTIHTTFFGDISQGNRITLVPEDVPLPASPEATPDTRKEWRVDWTPSLIFAELDDKSLVHFFTDVPRRGSILARNGEAMAVDADLPVVGFVSDLMTDKEALISSLAAALTMPESDIRAKVETDLPSYYFIPITTLPYGTSADTIAEKPARPGKDVTLTLDINAQKTAETVLGERVGSIIVMDPRDNSVLALASYPRLNPQAITDGLSTEEYAALSNDKRQPFLNRPLLATYPPGSTFKPVTLAAGMEKAGVSAGETFPCVPVWKALGEDFPKNNWQKADRR